MEALSESDVARELLLEWGDAYLNVVYKSGIGYTAWRLLRSLTVGWRNDPFIGPFNDPLSVSFFLNDYRTLEEHRARVAGLRVVHVNGLNLGFITHARGVRWVITRLLQGTASLRRADASSNGKSRAVPLLGWLLYRHLVENPQDGATPSRYVIANLVHPVVLGAAFGFARRGVPVDFVEHAMTPRVLMRPVPIENAYVFSPHTAHAWREHLPTSRPRLHCMGEGTTLTPPRYRLPAEPRTLICVNPLDTLAAIESMLNAVAAVGGRATVRLHDADPRTAAISSLTLAAGAQISLASRSPITQDLDLSDLVICGNSNVLLDSLRRQRRVIYYWPNEASRFDYYGCVEYYGVESATSESGLRLTIVGMISTSAAS